LSLTYLQRATCIAEVVDMLRLLSDSKHLTTEFLLDIPTHITCFVKLIRLSKESQKVRKTKYFIGIHSSSQIPVLLSEHCMIEKYDEV
jgi:hypothetical protein